MAKSQATLKIVGGRNPSLNYDRVWAIACGTVAGRQSPSLASRLGPVGRPSTIAGHRTYLDNVRLISTRVRKPPIPRGHRSWLA